LRGGRKRGSKGDKGENREEGGVRMGERVEEEKGGGGGVGRGGGERQKELERVGGEERGGRKRVA